MAKRIIQPRNHFCLGQPHFYYSYLYGLKLKGGRFRLVIREKTFTVRVVKHWKRFAKKSCGCLIPVMFSARLMGI